MRTAADPWLHVVGIGEDGVDGLSNDARAVLEQAEIILGGDRHHRLSEAVSAERIAWPSPFDAMIDAIRAQKGRRFAILTTGDPLWYSVGARLLRAFDASEIRFHPQLSSFQWAACRLGWSLADVETLTVHGRPIGQAFPFFARDARLLLLTKDGGTPAAMARALTERGFGPSRMVVLGALGGPDETRIDGEARSWSAAAPDFHLLAVHCQVEPGARPLPRTGLPDDAFAHDGVITKRAVRAATLARLAPRRGQLLWDVGCGSGSVAIEWMRADRDMRAIGLEPNAKRRAMAEENAERLGAPRLELSAASAPGGLAGLPTPDAVFLGGGLSEAAIEAALRALGPGGRLVANAVTLESEALLASAQAEHGGDLMRVAVQHAEPIGGYRGWRAAMPVTQWIWEAR